MTVSRRDLLIGAGAAALSVRSAIAATPIDKAGFVQIGGIDQWIAIQGQNPANPTILYLHGGPGEAQSPFLKSFVPWEHDFTVVNWDQRGAGKTFEKNGEATPDMTLERLTDDAIEVTRHALKRLGKRKLSLVGSLSAPCGDSWWRGARPNFITPSSAPGSSSTMH